MKLSQLISSLLLAFLASTHTGLALAASDVWRTAPAQFGDKEATESRFIYVGKGETWLSPTFKSTANVSFPSSISIRLNGQAVFSSMLSANRVIEFPLGQLKEGFNRLDFLVRQTPLMAAEQSHINCEVGTFGVFNLGQGELSYTRQIKELMLSNLPDVLFNPHVLDRKPYVARIRINTESPTELTALSRLANAWPAVSGVRWVESTLSESHRADFTVEFNKDSQYENNAHISLYFAQARPSDESHPILRINYGTDQALISAINGLTNKSYLSQLKGNGIRVPDSINEPTWGALKQFNTLADLGLESFRLDSASRAFVLSFPGVWHPTGPLQGNLALRSQSNLIQGSNVTIWINDALSGGAGLDRLSDNDTSRIIPFLSKAPLDNNNYELRVESNLLVSNECSAPKGSMWVDTELSEAGVPFRIKRGVSSINVHLVNKPTISVDGNEGAFGIATTLFQEAARMLLDGKPLRSTIVVSEPAKVSVLVDANKFDEKVAQYPESLYAAYANGGVFVSANDDSFELLAQGAFSAENFIYYWPRVQSKITDGASEVLITQDGEVKLLKTVEKRDGLTPTVQDSTIYLYALFVTVLMITGLLVWLWWTRRAGSKT
ncbi:MAG: hypothetical protein Q8L72_01940 [Moraxellaceae bacterium]|nr:hypothetical protein [Moraxellaceae bacterium]